MTLAARIPAEKSDGDINPHKLLLKMECPRSHNSSLIVKELIKPVASLLTEFYDVNFTTGQAKSGICGLHRGLLAPDKKALMIFSMSTAESQVIHQQSLPVPTGPGPWQLGITFLAWFRAAPSHGAQKHTRVPGQVHIRASWHKTNTDHQPGKR